MILRQAKRPPPIICALFRLHDFVPQPRLRTETRCWVTSKHDSASTTPISARNDGIVRPHAAVHERVAAILQGTEESWRGGGRCRHLRHVLHTVKLEVRMVRRLEDVHLAVVAVERWDAQPRERLSELSLPQRLQQQRVERRAVVSIPKQARGPFTGTLHKTNRAVAPGRKDLAAPFNVHPRDVRRAKSSPEAQGDDASGRCAGD